MKDNNWLVDYCKAQVGRPYWFGTFGQIGSASLYQSKQNQYPNQYPPKKFTKDSFVKGYGKKVHDCAGLIKGALWCDSYDDPTPVYKASEDYGANKMFTNATKNGSMETFIDLPGILVFKGTDKTKNHVGVYIGNGKCIEAKGHNYGVVTSDISTWKYWCMSNLFTYGESVPVHEPTIEVYKVKVNTVLNVRKGPGTNYPVVGKLKNGVMVSVYETSGTWARIGTDKWVSMNYLHS